MFVTQKRTSSSQATLTQKKTKCKPNAGIIRPLAIWLGFQAMNWTNRGKGLSNDNYVPIATLGKNEMRENKARECQSTIPSFSFVITKEWPNSRDDRKSGQHFNLAQISSDVEFDKFGFPFYYQIAIFF